MVWGPMNANGAIPRAVLIVDDHEMFRSNMASAFRRLGWEVWVTSDHHAAVDVALDCHPRLIVTELRIGNYWALKLVTKIKAVSPHSKIVIATIYPSVATAVRAMRSGFDAYFAKPVEAEVIIEAAFAQACSAVAPPDDLPSPPDRLPTLNRTIWEYLNQVFVQAGTMAEAARRLGIDRRSLRRMLARHPPAQ